MLALIEYLAAAALLGAGISVDIAITTIAIRKSLQTFWQGFRWAAGVTLLHIALPMIGFYVFVSLNYYHEEYALWFGIVGSGLIFTYLICSILGEDANQADEETSKPPQVNWLLIIAVSWDAMLAGPAKSAQAIDWSSNQIFWSFFIAGAVVTIVTFASLKTAMLINTKDYDRPGGASFNSELFAKWLEYSVIGYFGKIAIVRYVLNSDVIWPVVLAFSFFIWACIIFVKIKIQSKNIYKSGQGLVC